jgi:hypothetical protein
MKKIDILKQIGIFTILIFLVTAVPAMASNKTALNKEYATINDNLVGGWSYTVEGAPEGYQNGLLIIVKDGENYKVQVQVGGGTLLGENVKVSGNSIDFEVMVEGGRVSVDLTAKGDTISGKSTSSEGSYNIKGEKSLSMG